MPIGLSREVNKTAGRARLEATAVLLIGLAATSIFLPSEGDVISIFAFAAIGVGVSLTVATVVEGLQGVRSLIRVDLLMLWVLYGLTFFEFLFPQDALDTGLTVAAAKNGTIATCLGFAGLSIGRHLVPFRSKSKFAAFTDVQPRSIFALFVFATLVGYFHILWAVNFDPIEMIRQMLLPRFQQSWGRERYGGDISALLFEVGALIYLIPPLAGLMYARSNDFSTLQRAIVTLVLLLTIFYGFTGGTRNVLATYLITFFGAYYLNKQKIKFWKLALQGGGVVALLLVASQLMLEFRSAGATNFSYSNAQRASVYIDRNLIVISRLTEVFPDTYDFLGWDIPYHILIHPIPRMLWAGKPEGLSVTVESVVGTDQATIASTFVGESYMAGGMLGVLLAGILFGAGGEMWNRVGRDARMPFSQLLYASGFFCAAISMRSALWMSVTMLPTLALWLYGKLWLSRASRRRTHPLTSSGGKEV